MCLPIQCLATATDRYRVEVDIAVPRSPGSKRSCRIISRGRPDMVGSQSRRNEPPSPPVKSGLTRRRGQPPVVAAAPTFPYARLRMICPNGRPSFRRIRACCDDCFRDANGSRSHDSLGGIPRPAQGRPWRLLSDQRDHAARRLGAAQTVRRQQPGPPRRGCCSRACYSGVRG